jgi:hypothetical protein
MNWQRAGAHYILRRQLHLGNAPRANAGPTWVVKPADPLFETMA